MNGATDPVELSIARAGAHALRALRLRCPNCGVGTLFASWLRMRRVCPSCGLRLDRGNDDYFIGGYLVNLIAAELLVVAGLLVVLAATWPAVPWTALTYGLAALMVPAPFVTYPYSKAIWLAIDLHFQPVTPGDFEGVTAEGLGSAGGRAAPPAEATAR